MGNCLSKDKLEGGDEPAIDVANVGSKKKPAATESNGASAKKDTPQDSAVVSSSKNLLSDRKNLDVKDEVVNTEKTAAALDMGLQIIDWFQKAAKATEVVIPSPLGDVLEKVTSVLEILKVSTCFA